MKYRIEEYPNPERIGIDISKKLTEEVFLSFEAPKYALNETNMFGNPVEESLRYLAAALFQIDGVIDVSLRPYHITIGKSPIFEWKDIEPEIIRTINVMVADKEDMEELPRKTMSDLERKRIQRQFERDWRDFDLDFRGMDDDDDFDSY